MKKILMSLLFLSSAASAQPLLFKGAEPVQGRVLLVAEEGEAEAKALAAAGFDCGLSHAQELQQIVDDENWLKNQVLPPFPARVVVIGLGSTSPLVWKLGRGDICIDPQPQAQDYPLLATAAKPDLDSANPLSPALVSRPYESSLIVNLPLVLVAPDSPQELSQKLGPNCHQVAGSLEQDNSPLQKEVRRWLAIQQPLKPLGLPDTPFIASPNWGVRSLGNKIDAVVIHSTVINTLAGTERAFFDDNKRRVSAHYVVDRDGTTVQMVDERRAAWHAGVSQLGQRSGVNDFSVGIELVNLNDGKDPYPEAQYQAVASIIRDLRKRWNVPDEHIVSHAEIALPVGRKSDPLGFNFIKLKQMLKP